MQAANSDEVSEITMYVIDNDCTCLDLPQIPETFDFRTGSATKKWMANESEVDGEVQELNTDLVDVTGALVKQTRFRSSQDSTLGSRHVVSRHVPIGLVSADFQFIIQVPPRSVSSATSAHPF